MKSHKEKFLTAIIRAGNHASVGDKTNMNRYISEAKLHHKNHVSDHEKQHGRNAAKEEHTRLGSYYSHIEDIWTGKDVKKSELSKSKGFGSNPSNAGSSPYRREFNATGKTGDMKVGRPGQDKRYSYKHFSELTPDQQVAVKHKFQGARDIEDHHYPLNNEGQVAHAARWLDPSPKVSNDGLPHANKKNHLSAANAPEADEGYSKPKLTPDAGEVLSHHKRESAVRISSDGHEHHGKLGIVQAPSPYHPGKVHVQVNKKGGGVTSTFVEPHEAVPNKMTKTDDNVISLTKAVLEKIKKRR